MSKSSESIECKEAERNKKNKIGCGELELARNVNYAYGKFEMVKFYDPEGFKKFLEYCDKQAKNY